MDMGVLGTHLPQPQETVVAKKGDTHTRRLPDSASGGEFSCNAVKRTCVLGI